MSIRSSVLSLSVLLVTATAVFAHCPVCGDLVPMSYVVPVVYYPAPAAPTCCPMPTRYACPTPAPASIGPTTLNTHEPPLSRPPGKGPTISQNRTFGGVPHFAEPRTQHCKVSFWNLSGFDVNLSVGDRIVPLAKDRATTLDLDRTFTWRTQFHGAKAEEVPDDVNHFEVMIK